MVLEVAQIKFIFILIGNSVGDSNRNSYFLPIIIASWWTPASPSVIISTASSIIITASSVVIPTSSSITTSIITSIVTASSIVVSTSSTASAPVWIPRCSKLYFGFNAGHLDSVFTFFQAVFPVVFFDKPDKAKTPGSTGVSIFRQKDITDFTKFFKNRSNFVEADVFW